MKKTMPKGEAKPLGTKKNPAGLKTVKSGNRQHTHIEGSVGGADHDAATGKSQAENATEEKIDNTEKVVDNAPSVGVNFSNRGNDAATETGDTKMEIVLSLDTKARKSSAVVYSGEGLRSGVRIAKSAFANKTAPTTITIVSDSFAQPKVKETKEERKARLAAAPKLTLAEKIAKREASLQALKDKAAKQAAPAV